MVQINFALKEVNCKIVYYGPGMSGKTTNLEIVHKKAPEANKGELTSIATEGDRTLFFDFMPLDLGNIAGMRTKFQLYTVPGQVYYNSTRKLVLQGVDGIIFVADSQEGKMEENLESMENLRNNLAEYGKKLDDIPMVVQYNKRDLPNIMDVDYLNEKLNPRGLPFFEGVATTGEGVFPTLKALSAMVLESLSKEKRGHGGPPARRGAPSRPPAEAPVAAAAPGASASAPGAAAAQATREETFGHDSGLKEQVAQAQAQASAAPPPAQPAAPPPPAQPEPSPPGPDDTATRIRKGVSAFYTSPPETQQPSQAAPPTDEPGTMTPPAGMAVPPAFQAPPQQSFQQQPSFQPPQQQQPSFQPPPQQQPPQEQGGPGFAGGKPQRQNVSSPLVQKFVIEEERGSPILLVALVFIIVLAAAVILYSFNIL